MNPATTETRVDEMTTSNVPDTTYTKPASAPMSNVPDLLRVGTIPDNTEIEVETDILSEGTDQIIAGLPLRRIGQPSEVANAIYFLCSENSSYVTGAEISINGGQHV